MAKKPMLKQITVRLPADIDATLHREAVRLSVAKGELVRQALALYLRRPWKPEPPNDPCKILPEKILK